MAVRTGETELPNRLRRLVTIRDVVAALAPFATCAGRRSGGRDADATRAGW
jgi:hypothetical protein